MAPMATAEITTRVPYLKSCNKMLHAMPGAPGSPFFWANPSTALRAGSRVSALVRSRPRFASKRWTRTWGTRQSELARKVGTSQSVIARLEDDGWPGFREFFFCAELDTNWVPRVWRCSRPGSRKARDPGHPPDSFFERARRRAAMFRKLKRGNPDVGVDDDDHPFDRTLRRGFLARTS